jgi:segregation and condensation protein A
LQDDYKVELEVFEGPLDLLLYLIRKDELDIYDIPIERITSQYMNYIQLMKMLDLNIAGEFLVMASTLMLIKSKLLLPVDDRSEDEDEDEDDPRWDLVRQLVEYKKFKDAANHLEGLEHQQENVFSAMGDNFVIEPDPGLALNDVGIFDLIAAFNEILKDVKEEELDEIVGDQYTVADKIETIRLTLQERSSVPFRELFSERPTRGEVVCTFLALLELTRLSQLKIKQSQAFGEIVVLRPEC